ncbi:MAG: hypothetical protein AAF416_14380 [Pseudomonadota bacterium]
MADRTETLERIQNAELGHLTNLGDALRDLLEGSFETQLITEAAEIALPEGAMKYVGITGPTSSSYAVTLAAPARAMQILVIEMTGTTATNTVTMALANVAGGSAATTATFDAANETLVLFSSGGQWNVLSEGGVALS